MQRDLLELVSALAVWCSRCARYVGDVGSGGVHTATSAGETALLMRYYQVVPGHGLTYIVHHDLARRRRQRWSTNIQDPSALQGWSRSTAIVPDATFTARAGI